MVIPINTLICGFTAYLAILLLDEPLFWPVAMEVNVEAETRLWSDRPDVITAHLLLLLCQPPRG